MSTSTVPPGGARDQDATGFTRHLDVLMLQVPEALCAVFVDGEGETVDLATRVDPFEARIAGAELAIVLASLRASQRKLGSGESLELRVEGAERSLVARTVAEGYDLIVVLGAPSVSARAAEATAATALALLRETGMKPRGAFPVLRAVEHRQGRTGIPIPSAFEENGVRRRIEVVLGHRNEGEETAFLVRLDDGEEMVLMCEASSGRWRRR